MSIKIASVLALCTTMAIAAPAIWDGSADVSWYVSSAQAYNLTTAEQLAGLAKLVNQGTSSFEGKTITLGADFSSMIPLVRMLARGRVLLIRSGSLLEQVLDLSRENLMVLQEKRIVKFMGCM